MSHVPAYPVISYQKIIEISAQTAERYASSGTEEYQSTNRCHSSLQLTTPTVPQHTAMYRCHNYLHSLCGLPYSSRSWHCLLLLSSNVCNVYSSQSLDLIPSQLSPLRTHLSHIDFNIVLQIMSSYSQVRFSMKSVLQHTICERLNSLLHPWRLRKVLVP
jgi:hypothetical protein